MLTKILFAWCLVATTVLFHSAALAIPLNPVFRLIAQLETHFWPVTWLLVRITWWLIVVHLVEIAIWGLFYWWQKCLPDAESSLYFSGVITIGIEIFGIGVGLLILMTVVALLSMDDANC